MYLFKFFTCVSRRCFQEGYESDVDEEMEDMEDGSIAQIPTNGEKVAMTMKEEGKEVVEEEKDEVGEVGGGE